MAFETLWETHVKLFKQDVIDPAEELSLILNATLFPLKLQLNLKPPFSPAHSENAENPH